MMFVWTLFAIFSSANAGFYLGGMINSDIAGPIVAPPLWSLDSFPGYVENGRAMMCFFIIEGMGKTLEDCVSGRQCTVACESSFGIEIDSQPFALPPGVDCSGNVDNQLYHCYGPSGTMMPSQATRTGLLVEFLLPVLVPGNDWTEAPFAPVEVITDTQFGADGFMFDLGGQISDLMGDNVTSPSFLSIALWGGKSELDDCTQVIYLHDVRSNATGLWTPMGYRQEVRMSTCSAYRGGTCTIKLSIDNNDFSSDVFEAMLCNDTATLGPQKCDQTFHFELCLTPGSTAKIRASLYLGDAEEGRRSYVGQIYNTNCHFSLLFGDTIKCYLTVAGSGYTTRSAMIGAMINAMIIWTFIAVIFGFPYVMSMGKKGYPQALLDALQGKKRRTTWTKLTKTEAVYVISAVCWRIFCVLAASMLVSVSIYEISVSGWSYAGFGAMLFGLFILAFSFGGIVATVWGWKRPDAGGFIMKTFKTFVWFLYVIAFMASVTPAPVYGYPQISDGYWERMSSRADFSILDGITTKCTDPANGVQYCNDTVSSLLYVGQGVTKRGLPGNGLLEIDVQTLGELSCGNEYYTLLAGVPNGLLPADIDFNPNVKNLTLMPGQPPSGDSSDSRRAQQGIDSNTHAISFAACAFGDITPTDLVTEQKFPLDIANYNYATFAPITGNYVLASFADSYGAFRSCNELSFVTVLGARAGFPFSKANMLSPAADRSQESFDAWCTLRGRPLAPIFEHGQSGVKGPWNVSKMVGPSNFCRSSTKKNYAGGWLEWKITPPHIDGYLDQAATIPVCTSPKIVFQNYIRIKETGNNVSKVTEFRRTSGGLLTYVSEESNLTVTFKTEDPQATVNLPQPIFFPRPHDLTWGSYRRVMGGSSDLVSAPNLNGSDATLLIGPYAACMGPMNEYGQTNIGQGGSVQYPTPPLTMHESFYPLSYLPVEVSGDPMQPTITRKASSAEMTKQMVLGCLEPKDGVDTGVRDLRTILSEAGATNIVIESNGEYNLPSVSFYSTQVTEFETVIQGVRSYKINTAPVQGFITGIDTGLIYPGRAEAPTNFSVTLRTAKVVDYQLTFDFGIAVPFTTEGPYTGYGTIEASTVYVLRFVPLGAKSVTVTITTGVQSGNPSASSVLLTFDEDKIKLHVVPPHDAKDNLHVEDSTYNSDVPLKGRGDGEGGGGFKLGDIFSGFGGFFKSAGRDVLGLVGTMFGGVSSLLGSLGSKIMAFALWAIVIYIVYLVGRKVLMGKSKSKLS